MTFASDLLHKGREKGVVWISIGHRTFISSDFIGPCNFRGTLLSCTNCQALVPVSNGLWVWLVCSRAVTHQKTVSEPIVIIHPVTLTISKYHISNVVLSYGKQYVCGWVGLGGGEPIRILDNRRREARWSVWEKTSLSIHLPLSWSMAWWRSLRSALTFNSLDLDTNSGV